MKPLTRKEAMALGLPRYSGGRPCKEGHTERQTVNGSCIQCTATRVSAQRKTSAYRQKRNAQLREARATSTVRLRERVYALENRDRRAEWGARWRNSPKGKDRAHRKNVERYGISATEYSARLNQQKGGCAICGDVPTRRRLDVDHEHGTNKVRGLLCSGCNTGLGLFRDSPELLREAASYLEDNA